MNFKILRSGICVVRSSLDQLSYLNQGSILGKNNDILDINVLYVDDIYGGNILKPMKNLCLVIAVSGLLTSCCVFTSQDCGCKPSEPFLAEETKDWIVPFLSENQKFITTGSSSVEQQVNRVYQEGSECIGGDECCTNYPTHTASFFFGAFQDMTLLYIKAIQNEVHFSSEQDGFPPDTFIASFDVITGKFLKSAAVNLLETDTVINGSKHLKVIFQKIDPTKNKILFKRLEFVKGVGVTGYIDTSGEVWKKE
jgi:hypothetical protein